MERLIRAAAITFGVLLWPVSGFADSINPVSYGTQLSVGGSVTIPISVTVTSTPRSDAMVDVYLLADTTDSMDSTISAVQASASTILSDSANLGDVQFAVGEYKDDPTITSDPYAYRLNTSMTSDTAAVQTGIDLWAASGGGDFPEANLYAIDQLATSAQTGWRQGATRILVWFGDAFGHDPSLGVDLATASDALVANNIVVEAINVGTNAFGLDATGQATALATATGGDVYTGIDSSTIVSTISTAIKYVIDNYSTVCLDTSSVPSGVTVVSDPCFTGTFDRTSDQTFTFNVTFTGITEGSYDFPLYATVDGGRIATHNDSIVVSTTVPVPPPDGGGSSGGGGSPGGGGDQQQCSGHDGKHDHDRHHGRHHDRDHDRHHGRHHDRDHDWRHDRHDDRDHDRYDQVSCCPHEEDGDEKDDYDKDSGHKEHCRAGRRHHEHHEKPKCKDKPKRVHKDDCDWRCKFMAAFERMPERKHHH